MRLLILFLFGFSLAAQPINPIIGDSSWFYFKKDWPKLGDSEEERIKTHLIFVHQQLSSSGPKSEQGKHLLNALWDYIEAGDFPKYFKHEDARRPCFIDDAGTLCAVGHLIAVSEGRKEAERINRLFRFEYLLKMADEGLTAWQQNSGFSMKELAMIQPTYRPVQQVQILRSHGVFIDPETNLMGLISHADGSVVLKATFNSLSYQNNSPYLIGFKDGGYYAFNAVGKKLSRKKFKRAFIFGDQDSNCLVAIDDKNQLHLFPEDNKKSHRSLKSTSFFYSSENRLLFKQNGLYGAINTAGEIEIPAIYDSICVHPNIINAKLIYRVKDSLWGLRNSKGDIISPLQSQSIVIYKNLFRCSEPGKADYLIGPQGKKYQIPTKLNYSRTADYNSLILEEEGKVGVFSTVNYNWQLPPKYDHLIFNSQIGLYQSEREGKIGFVHPYGSETIPVEFDYARAYASFIILEKEGKMGLFNLQGAPIFPVEYDTLSIALWSQNPGQVPLVRSLKNGVFKLRYANGISITIDENTQDLESIGASHIAVQRSPKGVRPVVFKAGRLVALHPQWVDSVVAVSHASLIYRKGKYYGFYRLNKDALNAKAELLPARFDTIMYNFRNNHDRFLIKEKGLWGMYSLSEDSFIAPPEYERFYPLDLYDIHNWIYFSKGGLWRSLNVDKLNVPMDQKFSDKLTQKFLNQREYLKIKWID